MDFLREKLIKAIKSAPSEKALGEYLFKAAKKISPDRYPDSTVTLDQAILNLLDREPSKIDLHLSDPKFKELSKFFALTPGLHILAAPSGHGKTFWAMQWASEAARKGNKVLMVSLEMTAEDLGARTLTQFGELKLSDIVRGRLSEVQKKLLKSVVASEEKQFMQNIAIDTFGSLDWVKIYPRLIDQMIKIRPRLVIIDYIQMIFDSEEHQVRMSQTLSNIARDLKQFADETECAVLLLSQMNREVLKEAKKSNWSDIGYVPMSHEFIKESGGIVEAADTVQLICIPAKFAFCQVEFRNKFQITVDKSRRLGELGTVLLDFDPVSMEFL